MNKNSLLLEHKYNFLDNFLHVFDYWGRSTLTAGLK